LRRGKAEVERERGETKFALCVGCPNLIQEQTWLNTGPAIQYGRKYGGKGHTPRQEKAEKKVDALESPKREKNLGQSVYISERGLGR